MPKLDDHHSDNLDDLEDYLDHHNDDSYDPDDYLDGRKYIKHKAIIVCMIMLLLRMRMIVLKEDNCEHVREMLLVKIEIESNLAKHRPTFAFNT